MCFDLELCSSVLVGSTPNTRCLKKAFRAGHASQLALLLEGTHL